MKVWVVRFGLSVWVHYTDYHAAQTVRALTLNGTPCTLVEEVR